MCQLFTDLGKKPGEAIQRRDPVLQAVNACNSPLNPTQAADYSKVRYQLNVLLAQEEDFWKQRDKCHWLEVGDSHPKYFYALASAWKRTNRIDRLQDRAWVSRSSKEDLHSIAVDYFSTIFKAYPNSRDPNLPFVKPVITDDGNARLVLPFSVDEFKKAVFQMHPDKSPGPSGFNPAFFHKF